MYIRANIHTYMHVYILLYLKNDYEEYLTISLFTHTYIM